MTGLGSLQGHHHGDSCIAGTSFSPDNSCCCINCGQKLLIGNNEARIGAGVVAFTSFVKNEKAHVSIKTAVQEVFSILRGIELENDLENDLENCALCVDCSLIFAQLFGLFQTFESRRKADGLLGTALIKGVRWASEFRKIKSALAGLHEIDERVPGNDLLPEFERFKDGCDHDNCDSMEVEIQNESGSDDAVRAETISSRKTQDRHPRDIGGDASDSDNGQDGSNKPTSPECEISEEESDDGSWKAASRSIIVSKVNSVQDDAKTESMSSSDSVKHRRKSRRIQRASTTDIKVTNENANVDTLVESDYAPPSSNSDKDSDDDADPPDTRKNVVTQNSYTEADRIFKCIDCDVGFPVPGLLRHHRTDAHGADLRTLICHICRYTATHGASFKRHMLRHTGAEGQKCSKCGKLFKLFENLQKHMKGQHKIMLRRHLNNFSSDPLSFLCCRKCEAEFESEEGLFRHSKDVHGDERGKPKNKCRFCNKRYYSRSNRKIHEMAAHHQATVTGSPKSGLLLD